MTQSNCNIYWTYSLRYFHKVPTEAPLLELKANYGLVEPVAFELPPLSDQCTPQVYATFDLTKGVKNDKVRVYFWFLLFKSIENWILLHNIMFQSCFCYVFYSGQTQGRGGETSEGTRFETSERHRLYHLLNTNLSFTLIIH